MIGWIITGLLILAITFIFLAAIVLRWQVFVSSTNQWPGDQVLLSFDDGPHPEYTPAILQLLAQYKIKSFFFIIGSSAERYPEIVRMIQSDGHTIGNHSYAHSIKNTFSAEKDVRQDLSRTNKIIKELTGSSPIWYRPPFGVTNPNIARAIRLLDMKVLGWSFRTYDTLYKNANHLSQKIVSGAKAGDIILLHDDRINTLEALPAILRGLKDRNLV